MPSPTSRVPRLLPIQAQAVEAQVNLEKLHQEAHAANLRRAGVKELYMKVG